MENLKKTCWKEKIVEKIQLEFRSINSRGYAVFYRNRSRSIHLL